MFHDQLLGETIEDGVSLKRVVTFKVGLPVVVMV